MQLSWPDNRVASMVHIAVSLSRIYDQSLYTLKILKTRTSKMINLTVVKMDQFDFSKLLCSTASKRWNGMANSVDLDRTVLHCLLAIIASNT